MLLRETPQLRRLSEVSKLRRTAIRWKASREALILDSKHIPWVRILAEGAVVVVSILLAFGIDAWWDDRQLREEEQRALQGLREDLLASQAELSSVLAALVDNRDHFGEFQASTPELIRQWPSDAVSLWGLSSSPTFDAYTGTLDALVGAGKLDLIRDARLRNVLVAWMKGLDDLPENLNEMRAEASRISHAMEAFGGPFFRPIDRFDLSILPEVGAETLSKMRASQAVMGAARSHQEALAFYRGDLERLVPLIDSALILIDENTR